MATPVTPQRRQWKLADRRLRRRRRRRRRRHCRRRRHHNRLRSRCRSEAAESAAARCRTIIDDETDADAGGA